MPLRFGNEVLTQCWRCNDVQAHELGVGYRPEGIRCHCGARVEVLTVNGRPYALTPKPSPSGSAGR